MIVWISEVVMVVLVTEVEAVDWLMEVEVVVLMFVRYFSDLNEYCVIVVLNVDIHLLLLLEARIEGKSRVSFDQ